MRNKTEQRKKSFDLFTVYMYTMYMEKSYVTGQIQARNKFFKVRVKFSKEEKGERVSHWEWPATFSFFSFWLRYDTHIFIGLLIHCTLVVIKYRGVGWSRPGRVRFLTGWN